MDSSLPHLILLITWVFISSPMTNNYFHRWDIISTAVCRFDDVAHIMNFWTIWLQSAMTCQLAMIYLRLAMCGMWRVMWTLQYVLQLSFYLILNTEVTLTVIWSLCYQPCPITFQNAGGFYKPSDEWGKFYRTVFARDVVTCLPLITVSRSFG